MRRGSGGKGKYRGGDGTIRRIRFEEPMTTTILSSHRESEPYGLAGGEAGATGRNTVERKTGGIDILKGADGTKVKAGDVFVIETPGGGGFGST